MSRRCDREIRVVVVPPWSNDRESVFNSIGPSGLLISWCESVRVDPESTRAAPQLFWRGSRPESADISGYELLPGLQGLIQAQNERRPIAIELTAFCWPEDELEIEAGGSDHQLLNPASMGRCKRLFL